ncbi:MAG: DUF192 domain-containing protein, partial [Bdellovibrionales bacterium]|nr:DUF192 domain-containing protein [Bdellovibrionales bacterium]
MPSNEKWRKQQYQQVGIVIFLLLALVAAVYGYAQYRENAGLLPVTFQTEKGETPRFYMEIANTPSQRQKGLMFRKSLDKSRGMIFLFPREEPRGFWMKNTYISLDMVFISSDWEVVGVRENTPPLTEDRQSVPGVSQYVIEL